MESQALLLPPCSPVLITDELSFGPDDQPYLLTGLYSANQLWRILFAIKCMIWHRVSRLPSQRGNYGPLPPGFICLAVC